jgi:undecaprenyl-diphosphatase
MGFIEILKVIFLGIVEGITEWLPISSTGHMLLVDEFLQLSMSDAFKEMFFVVIQLGAILAVVVIYWKELWPFEKEEGKTVAKMGTLAMWVKVIVACIPAGVLGILLDDWLEEYLHKPVVIALALIVYGVWFIYLEDKNKGKRPKVRNIDHISLKNAFLIGMFQVLSLIPGTSRSGATIIGGLTLGLSRKVAADFTFFLAVPVMFGASFIKLLKFGFHFTAAEAFALLLGMAVAFGVSIYVIKFLMQYIKKHDFKVFGWYRIVLGVIVLLFFGIKAIVA